MSVCKDIKTISSKIDLVMELLDMASSEMLGAEGDEDLDYFDDAVEKIKEAFDELSEQLFYLGQARETLRLKVYETKE